MIDFFWYQVEYPIKVFLAIMLWRIAWNLGESFVAWMDVYIGKMVRQGDEPDSTV